MNKLLTAIDTLSRTLATLAGGCALVMMFCQVFSVVARYVFSYGIISVQEAVIYGHSTLFLFGSAYLLQKNAHVRVDIFYGMLSPERRRLVDLIAMLFFVLPVCSVIAWMSWTYVARSWGTYEGSPQSGGIPAIFLLKTGILIFSISIALQAFAISCRLFKRDSDEDWQPDLAEPE